MDCIPLLIRFLQGRLGDALSLEDVEGVRLQFEHLLLLLLAPFLQLLQSPPRLLIVVRRLRHLRGRDSRVLVHLLLTEVLLVGYSLVVESLTMLKDLEFIFIELNRLVCFDCLVHHGFGLLLHLMRALRNLASLNIHEGE